MSNSDKMILQLCH